jgi:hypothetical protein
MCQLLVAIERKGRHCINYLVVITSNIALQKDTQWRYITPTLVAVHTYREIEYFFIKMYICLDACKKGFINGCRPVICLDACHLKGNMGGQLLCAIGKDGNDDMFPIAFTMAEVETK